VGRDGIVRPAALVAPAGQGDQSQGWNAVAQDIARQGATEVTRTIERVEQQYMPGSGSGQNLPSLPNIGGGTSGPGQYQGGVSGGQGGLYGGVSGSMQRDTSAGGAPAPPAAGVPTWAWVVGGVVLVAGAGTAVYFVTRKKK
jgi:hypothetical protein